MQGIRDLPVRKKESTPCMAGACPAMTKSPDGMIAYAALRLVKNSPIRASARRMFSVELA